MAPTPASAQGTIEPTENQCDCTATPSSPVAGSRATIENVCTGRAGAINFSCAGLSCCDCKPVATATVRIKAKSRRMNILDPPMVYRRTTFNVARRSFQMIQFANYARGIPALAAAVGQTPQTTHDRLLVLGTSSRGKRIKGCIAENPKRYDNYK